MDNKERMVGDAGEVHPWVFSERYLICEIKRVRNELGIGQKEFAQKVGLSQQEVSRIESGTTSPRLRTLCKLLTGVGCELVVVQNNKEEQGLSADDSGCQK